MSRIARPRNTNRKILYFYIILATLIFQGFEERKEGDNNKKQAFIVKIPPKLWCI